MVQSAKVLSPCFLRMQGSRYTGRTEGKTTMFMSEWSNLLAPWLLGVGGILGMTLACGLIYLRRHPEGLEHQNRLDPPTG